MINKRSTISVAVAQLEPEKADNFSIKYFYSDDSINNRAYSYQLDTSSSVSSKTSQISPDISVFFSRASQQDLNSTDSSEETLDFPVTAVGEKHRRSSRRNEWLKNIAVQHLAQQLEDALEILAHFHNCDETRFSRMVLPYKVFSWSLQDCLERRKFRMNWLPVLQRAATPECLEIRKIMVDFQEIRRYIKIIVDSYVQRNNKTRIERIDALALLRELEDLHVLDTKLENELAKNTAIWEADKKKFHETKLISDDWYDAAEERHDEALNDYCYHLMSNKYLIKFENTRCCQESLRFEKLKDTLNEKSKHYDDLMERDRFCFGAAMDMYYSEINQLRERIYKMSIRLDEDYEEINDDSVKLKFRLERLNEDRTFYTEALIRIRKQIEEENERILLREQEAIIKMKELLENKNVKRNKKRRKIVKKKL